MTVLAQMERFSKQYGKQALVNGTTWRYYCLGGGPPLLWLTGGLRRAAFGYAFMEKLAERRTIIAPDYPSVQKLDAFLDAFDAILRGEKITRFSLGGQSYGGMLAQAYLARRGEAVERLVLSSTGPADFGKSWLLAEPPVILLARLLPEKTVKTIFTGGLLEAIVLPEAERDGWLEAIQSVTQADLTRADVVSHFAVTADLIRKRIVTPAAYQDWTGRVVVLSAENDRTQSKKDFPRYERLFGRAVEVISLGTMGHAAALFNPDQYVQLLEQALA